MKVEKMYISNVFSNQYVVKKENGMYARFAISPIRQISERDLTNVPFYQETGNNSKEAPEYMYKLYGLHKDMED